MYFSLAMVHRINSFCRMEKAWPQDRILRCKLVIVTKSREYEVKPATQD
jgi:hypothetical protein